MTITDVLAGRSRWHVERGDCRDVLRAMPARSVHSIVTSPPYLGLRDYGVAGQIGLESTVAHYVRVIAGVMRLAKRVLRDDGTLWLNLGDSYANDGKWGGASGGKHVAELHGPSGVGRARRATGLPPKSLIGVPWLVAFALQRGGWTLRDDIVWEKLNPMPESVDDRPTRAHEFVFLLAKRERYFYDADAIREPHVDYRASKAGGSAFRGQATLAPRGRESKPDRYYHAGGRNKRDVWPIASEPYDGAHFAVMPRAVAEPCILAGTSAAGCCADCGAPLERVVEREAPAPTARGTRLATSQVSRNVVTGGTAHTTLGSASVPRATAGWSRTCDCATEDTRPCVVLDPFAGSGTVGDVALGHQRSAVLVELSADSAALARGRCADAEGPLFAAGGGRRR